jgi:hypothetical protein
MSESPPTLDSHAQAVRRLSEAFFRWVQTNLPRKPWTRAWLDVRYGSEGDYWNDKMRVETPDGPVVSLGTCDEIRRFLIEFSHLRKVLGWHGMKIVVDAGGEVTVTYNHDPHCADDPAFSDD